MKNTIKIALLAFILGAFSSCSSETQANSEIQVKTIEKLDTTARIYEDGEYIETVKGYEDGLQVKTTIVDNEIKDIEIISHNESEGFFEKPFESIPKKIIETQSTDVDIISGATMTSKGVISAVQRSLEKASN